MRPPWHPRGLPTAVAVTVPLCPDEYIPRAQAAAPRTLRTDIAAISTELSGCAAAEALALLEQAPGEAAPPSEPMADSDGTGAGLGQPIADETAHTAGVHWVEGVGSVMIPDHEGGSHRGLVHHGCLFYVVLFAAERAPKAPLTVSATVHSATVVLVSKSDQLRAMSLALHDVNLTNGGMSASPPAASVGSMSISNWIPAAEFTNGAGV
jgi:hypothetical protein